MRLFRRPSKSPRVRLATYSLLAAAGCRDPASQSGDVSAAGRIEVSARTSGEDLDPDGYRIILDGSPREALSGSGRALLANIAPGRHVLELAGVASNCTVGDGKLRDVNVPAAGVATVEFEVSCAVAQGSLRVSTRTTGNLPDPDGYVIRVSGAADSPIGLTDSILVDRVAAGTHQVALIGAASNCVVQGSDTVNVPIRVSATTRVTFTVSCAAPSNDPATIIAVVSTSIINAPATLSLAVELDGGAPEPVPSSGSVEFGGVPPGIHSLLLTGVPSYCVIGGLFDREPNPVTVTVASAEVRMVRFKVFCIG